MSWSRISVVFVATGFLLVQNGFGQTDPEDFENGLVGEYRDGQGAEFSRVDGQIAFRWGNRSPDERLAHGEFSVRWTGYLMSQARGEYRLYAFGSGKVRITLNGRVLIDGNSDEPRWFESAAVPLPYDWHRIEIDFTKKNDQAALSLYWSGPRFQLEPISPRFFYREPDTVGPDRFARGQELVRALRCGACHELPGDHVPLAAPALNRLNGNVSPTWLVDRITEKVSEQQMADGETEWPTIERRMPSFAIDLSEAKKIAAYLLDQSAVLEDADKPPADPTEPKRNGKPFTPDPAEGKRLLLSLGCLACHQVGDLGTKGLFDGGDLSRIANKRPAAFFARWLENPAKLNADHRMPVFELSRAERIHLSQYLAGLREAKTQTAQLELTRDAETIEEGRKLFGKYRCAACHRVEQPPRRPTSLSNRDIAGDAIWRNACVAEPEPSRGRPGYGLTDRDVESVREYLQRRQRSENGEDSNLDGRRLLAENNCLSCHSRDDAGGLGEVLPDVAKVEHSLQPLIPAMTPPPLHSVGDKLRNEALTEMITRKQKGHRPWLMVRMPRFPLSPNQQAAIVEYFVKSDRIPPREHEDPPFADAKPDAAAKLAGARLVTSDGFGCTSCHAVGDVLPSKAPLNAKGPDLLMLGRRIRPQWFNRWVRNPARIVPRMEMPSVQLAVRGVLQGDLEQQLAAVWGVLNTEDFKPPEPNPVRIARRSAVRERGERSLVLTDVIHIDNDILIKPFLVGLPNRHNVLIDLQRGRMVDWRVGDTARQRTKGKTWFWQVDGTNLLAEADGAELTLVRGDAEYLPIVVGQFVTEADSWRHTDEGLIMRHRLHMSTDALTSTKRIVLRVEQSFHADWNDGNLITGSGFRRRIAISGGRAGDVIRIRPTPPISGELGTIEVDGAVKASAGLNDVADGYEAVWPENQERLEFQLVYRTNLPVDSFPVIAPQPPRPEPVELPVVPGFRVTRLPLPDEVMPTGLAWTKGGKLVVTSLKGRVWLAHDSDGDGLEDRLEAYSDELAAPFGAASGDGFIDVINKYALLRMFDDDSDGHADRTETLASGWGHTADYHDWAIGLPRDDHGRYYIATACQQDNRSRAAAAHRGEVMRLVPREPTPANPHHFSIERISSGHRFPVGIARNRYGAMFVPDNQGNYNPFNELNHVRFGKHFGFINAIDRKRKDFKPPLTEPAIDIPHPWTRSVNGLTFLETPSRSGANHSAGFGRFEGNLIGCEYDTRRLIRMSLQPVNGTFQGAAYPFSSEPRKDDETFLGPLCAAVAPNGDVYIGSIRDSGWGGANNIGSIVRMQPDLESLPTGIACVRACQGGFDVELTRPVNHAAASRRQNYSISSYTRTSTTAYGGSDQQRRVDRISDVIVSGDGGSVRLLVEDLRPGFVYEIRVKGLVDEDSEFFPAEAYYTLRKLIK